MEAIKVEAKSLLNRLKRRDDWYKCLYTLNPYRGCFFSCPYCYDVAEKRRGKYHIYPSEVSKQIYVKTNASEVLRREIRRKPRDVVFIGSATDPYQPAEEKFKVSRRCLEVLVEAGWPVEVGTKSLLLERDLDLLAEASEKAFCCVFITVTTLDEELVKLFEPSAPKPEERLRLVERLSDAGINVCVAMIPVFPYLTDNLNHFCEVASEAAKHGAKYFMAGELTLPGEVKNRFYRLLEACRPELLPKYRQLYGASGYIQSSAYHAKIRRLEAEALAKFKLSREIALKAGLSLQDFL